MSGIFFKSSLLFVWFFFPCPKPVFLFLIGGRKAGLSDSWINLNRSQPITGPYNK